MTCETYCEYGGICNLEKGHEGLHDTGYCKFAKGTPKEVADSLFIQKAGGARRMKLQLKRCRTCGAVGVGPAAVRLFPLDGLLYCAPDFKSALDWTTNREGVTMGIERELRVYDRYEDLKFSPQSWSSFLHELSGMAAEALVMDDRRTFVHYFARALWAWELSREET